MNSLSFKNRASLTGKSDDLVKIVEELSSSYAKREDLLSSYVKRHEFASKHSNVFAAHTSEICSAAGVCFAAGAIVWVAAVAVTVVGLWMIGIVSWGVCYTEAGSCSDGNETAYNSIVDSSIYKNIV